MRWRRRGHSSSLKKSLHTVCQREEGGSVSRYLPWLRHDFQAGVGCSKLCEIFLLEVFVKFSRSNYATASCERSHFFIKNTVRKKKDVKGVRTKK